MLAEILRTRPGIFGTLVDLPRTVARSAETFEAAGVAGRVTTVGQSFFDPLPAGRDIYLLRGVLNDWPDREAAAILSRCAGKLHAPPVASWSSRCGTRRRAQNLEIETVLLGGKRRTVAEFHQLAPRRDWSAGRRAATIGYFVVECFPMLPNVTKANGVRS
jgi:hypothetical protein